MHQYIVEIETIYYDKIRFYFSLVVLTESEYSLLKVYMSVPMYSVITDASHDCLLMSVQKYIADVTNVWRGEPYSISGGSTIVGTVGSQHPPYIPLCTPLVP